MPRNLRRLYSLFAVLVFCVTAPMVVAWTSGYEWTGWRTGFGKVGAVFISSEPRATVIVNDQPRGQTPLRLNRLTPGNYTIKLEKTDYGSWQREIRIQPGVAQVIGPVYLYPAQITVTPYNLTASLSTEDRRAIFSVVQQGQTWLTTPQWPSAGTATTLPWQPTSAWGNPEREAMTYVGDQSVAFVNRQQTAPWVIPLPDQFQWLSTSDNVVFGLTNGSVNRYDTFTNTTIDIARADSATVVGTTIWLAQLDTTTTNILTLATYGQTVPNLDLQLPGRLRWLINGVAPLLQNTATREVVRLQRNPLTTQLTTVSYGVVDQIWWTDEKVAPLWMNGNDLWTLDADSRPQLLDRYSTATQRAAWLESERVLIRFDRTGLQIVSVSADQGRETLLSWSGENVQLLGLNLAEGTALVKTGETQTIVELSWAKKA